MSVRSFAARKYRHVFHALPTKFVSWVCAAGIAFALNGSSVWAQSEDAPKKTSDDVLLSKQIPIAEVDEPRFDFGDVWISNDLEHEFTIRNAGDAPMRIVRVKPSCGCTVAGDYPKQIEPGQSGKFPFKLNTKRLHGNFTKSITITTNDTKNSQIHLSLAGNVRHYVDLQPSIVQFGRVKPDSVITNKITLTNNTENPITVSVDEGQDYKCFSAEIKETQPGKVFELTVTAKPPYTTGINRVLIPVTTSIPEQEKLEVTCIATLPERIELRPDKLRIAARTRAETVRRFTLTNNGDKPLHITSAESSDDRISVETDELEPGVKYRLNAKIPAGYVHPPAGAAIVIKTDDAKDPEIRLPILGGKSRPKREPKRPAMTMLGKPAPDSQAATFKGDVLEIGGQHDKVQLLAFYASWCGFCKRALPKIEELQEQYADKEDVEIVAINLDDREGRRARTEAETIEHYEKMGLTMPMVMDSQKDISKPYKVTSFPTMFVISKKGEVEAVHVGARAGFEKTIASQIEILREGKTRADFPRGVASVPIAPAVRAQKAADKPDATKGSND